MDLIVYNLGYLPKSDKKVITEADTTLKSLNSAIDLLNSDGLLSITCYPGHCGGGKESVAVLNWSKNLDKNGFHVIVNYWLNRSKNAPFTILVEKKPI